jgi:uncharacterized protein (UPF0276 family)
MLLTAGLGFKPQHYDEAVECDAPGLWFEVHAENYMVDGGPRRALLEALNSRHPVSLHGVGLSIASPQPPEAAHLRRLVELAGRVRPVAVSDHLAWQRWRGGHLHDFLPFPRTAQALRQVTDNVSRVQDALGSRILIENPSLYVDLPGHQLSESDFLAELAFRTGCGLLLDVNNVFVSACNLGFNALAYIDSLPAEIIGEVHLAGHARDSDQSSALLIDTHDAPVAEPVWRLYARLIERIGPRPTLIERDDNLPDFGDLLVERARAHAILCTTVEAERHVRV